MKRTKSGRWLSKLELTGGFFIAALLGFSFLVSGCGDNGTTPKKTELCTPVEFSKKEMERVFRLSPLGNVPKSPSNKVADDPKAVQFGQYLFYEKGFSANGKVACASCHAPDKGWSDELETSKGVETVHRNAPTLWNMAYNRWYFWDGRADTIWAQALGPIEAPPEMGSSRLKLMHFVNDDAKLKAAYEALFGKIPDISDATRFPKDAKPDEGDPSSAHHIAWTKMTKEDQELVNRFYSNAGKSIAAFERKLISKDSKFDLFVEGWKSCESDGKKDTHKEKLDALSESAQRGLKLFVGQANCIQCHNGPNFTDGEFHNIGIGVSKTHPPDYGRLRGIQPVKDLIFNIMGAYSDSKTGAHTEKLRWLEKNDTNAGEFKTPTLRSVEQSLPYMHDGRFKTLKDVLGFYNELKTDTQIFGHREETLVELKLKEDQLTDLENFLKSLTGKPLPDSLLKQPASPTP